MSIDYSHTNVFVHDELDRLAEKRGDKRWAEQALTDDSTRFVLVWKNRCPLQHDRLHLATYQDLEGHDLRSVVLLGRLNEFTYFALDVGEDTDPPAPFNDWSFHDLRTIGTLLPQRPRRLQPLRRPLCFGIGSINFAVDAALLAPD